MSLSVKIENHDTSAYFLLKASDWQYSYSKTVTSVPLPGGQNFQMDLNMAQPSVKVSGTCDMTGTGGAGGIATRTDFETVISWTGAVIYLYENATTWYEGVIRNLNFRREPAMDYYTFDMEFVVKLNP